jgi:oxygen-independent coproporphyrinogen-3 oxidase
VPEVSTIFVGGGTPTLLGGEALAAMLHGVRDIFDLAPAAEVTIEANPETLAPALLETLREAGYTRISIGMQSAAQHVLQTLERQHTPGRALDGAAMARAAGFEHVSLDLIYGTPGESARDWDATLEAALSAEPDHISAYALIVEPGTRLAAAVKRGTTPAPDEDELADRYEQTDARLSVAGFDWYEVSNWARSSRHRCRHNDAYWTAGNWWGAGPGAHSQIGGVRWWNTLSPKLWAQMVSGDRSPAGGREPLTAEQQHLELVMLGVRRGDGLPLSALHPAGVTAAPDLVSRGLLDEDALKAGVARLTLRGRMLADNVTLALAA